MVDWDEDGDKDLIAGESDGHIHYFRNIGTATYPTLTNLGHLQAGGVDIDVGSLAIPVVQDWNEDGLKDLILGNNPANIRIYLNVGSNFNPVFNTFFYISSSPTTTQIKNAPDIGDLNGDGLKDLAFGWWLGTVVFYPNSGTNANPLFIGDHELTALGTLIDPGGWTHLELNDWDEDGDLDLVYGEWYGDVYLHLNLSSDLIAELTPFGAPVQIPASGGSFEFNASLINSTSHSVTADVWIVAKLPSGQETGPLLSASITLPPGGQIDRDRTQFVPASAPAGEYEYILRWGQFPDEPWAESSFEFSKLTDGDLTRWEGEWRCEGEPFTGEAIISIHPSEFILHPSCPNPFNPFTNLTFNLPEASEVSLIIYDIQGREVARLMDGFLPPGIHQRTFDGSNLPSGIYFARLQAGDFSQVKKMVLMK